MHRGPRHPASALWVLREHPRTSQAHVYATPPAVRLRSSPGPRTKAPGSMADPAKTASKSESFVRDLGAIQHHPSAIQVL